MEKVLSYQYLLNGSLLCKTCKLVGHDCNKGKAQVRPKVLTKKWVPKKVDKKEVQGVSVTDNKKDDQQLVLTPDQNFQKVTSHDDAGCKLVSNKSKDKGKKVMEATVHNPYEVLNTKEVVVEIVVQEVFEAGKEVINPSEDET